MKKLSTVVLLALLATACGDDEGGAPSDPRGQDIAAALQADPDFPMTEEEANCTASNILELDDATIDALAESSENTLALDALADPEQAVAAFDAVLDCVDIRERMVDGFIDDGTDRETAECIADAFSERELRTIIASASLPGSAVNEAAAFELLGKIFESAQECGAA